ncbi:MAG: DUF302 domain-containing protein, partial [Candidatus Krumholzibacteriia bacterium]
METVGTYSFEVSTRRSFDDAIARVTELLGEQGFGVLTEIDVKETLKKKLDVEYKPYTILGACNPHLARRALEAEPHVGVMLPCNVVVWDDGDHRVVAAMEPRVMIGLLESEEVGEVAEEEVCVRNRAVRVLLPLVDRRLRRLDDGRRGVVEARHPGGHPVQVPIGGRDQPHESALSAGHPALSRRYRDSGSTFPRRAWPCLWFMTLDGHRCQAHLPSRPGHRRSGRRRLRGSARRRARPTPRPTLAPRRPRRRA